MHKFFAKTSFLGKKVIFLPECHSTNDELAQKSRNGDEGLTIYTDHQISGRGQRGNIWQGEKGKNLLASVLLKPKFLPIKQHYFLYLISGLAAYELISGLVTFKERVKIKWPNDVLIGNSKVCGILIENNLTRAIEHSVIGFGVNLNQRDFTDVNATSIFLETGYLSEKESILENLLIRLEGWYSKLKSEKYDEIVSEYEQNMFWKHEKGNFLVDGEHKKGIISGIDNHGRLLVCIDEKEYVFDFKEIKYLIPQES